MASDDLLAQRDKIQREILALESTLGAGSNIADLLSSDSSSDCESEDSGPVADGVENTDLEAERQRIQRQIEELESRLGADAALIDALTETECDNESSDEDSDNELDLPQNVETCLQMNLVYQEVLKEKLAELEKVLNENQQQQKEIEAQISGPTVSSSSTPGSVPPAKLFVGYFLKPYFKDKITGLGPPANPEAKERMSHGIKSFDELKIKRWEGWTKALLTHSVATDTMKRMLQPKLSKLEYLGGKMSNATEEEREELKKQMDSIEKDIAEIKSMKEEQLLGNKNDDHDWEKISNIDFEGLRHAEDLKRFWQNYLHPSINKSVWKQDEIDKLREIAEKFNYCHWDKIAEALGTNRTAFVCFQTFQRYISKNFRRSEWTKEEDQILRNLVEKMRIGTYIPYIQMSYFMKGRDASQLAYRWTSVLDPSIKKGPWSEEEDQLLRNAVAKNGTREWWKIKMDVPGRTDGACRDRYLDCLQENVKKGAWSVEEVELLKQKVAKYGVGKWTKIASEIPNRIDCQCLNKWKLLTRASQAKKRVKSPKTVSQKPKRRKVMKNKIKVKTENKSSSEDEKEIKIEYMDSDGEQSVRVELDVPTKEEQEEQIIEFKKQYIQPDMKEWISVNPNPLNFPEGNVRTMLVKLPNNEDELESTKELSKSCIQSANSTCLPVRPSPVCNTIIDGFGNIKRTYVGMDPAMLQSWSANENAMIKVPANDVKNLIQWNAASVMKKNDVKEKHNKQAPKNEKKKMQIQKNTRKPNARKSVLNSCLKNDLLKAIIPWIGNVILPLPSKAKKLCEADNVGRRAANITLSKTQVFALFLKALRIDVDGCKNVIEVRQKKEHKKPRAEPKPNSGISVVPYSVKEMLKERNRLKAQKKELANPIQHPPNTLQHSLSTIQSLQAVHFVNHPQQPVKQVITPTLIGPNTLVITQPNMQGAVQPLLLNEQRLSLLPQSPQGISQISLPLIQLTAPVQPVTTSACSPTPNSPSIDTAKPARMSKRNRKPTEKALALWEQTKDKVSKKESPKENQGKQSIVVPTIAVQTQPVQLILTPTGLVPVTGMLSAHVPGKQMPNSSHPNNSSVLCTKASQNQSSSHLVFNPSSLNNSPFTCSVLPTPNSPQSPLVLPSSINITPPARVVDIQTAPSNYLKQNKSIPNSASQLTSQAPTMVNQKGALCHIETSGPTVLTQASSPTVLKDASGPTGLTEVRRPMVHTEASRPTVHTEASSPTVLTEASRPTVLTEATIQMVLTEVSRPTVLTEANRQMVPTEVNEPTVLTKNSSDSLENLPVSSSSEETILSQHQSSTCLSTGPSVSPAVTNVLSVLPSPSVFSASTSVGGQAVKKVAVATPQSVSKDGCVPVTIQQPAVIQKQGSPATIRKVCHVTPLMPAPQILAPVVPQITQPTQQLISNPDLSSSGLSFNPSLVFPDHPSKTEDWINGKGGISLPQLDVTLPYLPPSIASIKTLTSLLKAKQSMVSAAAKILPNEYQNGREEDAQVAAIRKLVAERFATNPAYLLLKARFLSCFTLPALLATINPYEDSPDSPTCSDDNEEEVEDTHLQQTGDNDQPQAARTVLNTNEKEASATQFSGINTRKRRIQNPTTQVTVNSSLVPSP